MTRALLLIGLLALGACSPVYVAGVVIGVAQEAGR